MASRTTYNKRKRQIAQSKQRLARHKEARKTAAKAAFTTRTRSGLTTPTPVPHKITRTDRSRAYRKAGGLTASASKLPRPARPPIGSNAGNRLGNTLRRRKLR